MPHFSDLKLYRDMAKNPDEFNLGLSREEKEELEQYDKKNESRPILSARPRVRSESSLKKGKKEAGGSQEDHLGKNFENLNSEAKKYEMAIETVVGFGLKEGVNNPKEKAVVENVKKIVLNYLEKILNDVNSYVAAANNLNLAVRRRDADSEKYRDEIEGLDAIRRNYHNKMINDIKIAVRLINVNFNKDYPEDFRLEEEKKYKYRSGLSEGDIKKNLSDRSYASFPYKNGGIIDLGSIPKDPNREREYIMSWAEGLYNSIADLEEDIKEILG